MVDVFHHVEERERYFRKLRASLKPGRVTAELKGAGYVLAAEHRFLPNQDFLVFRPAT